MAGKWVATERKSVADLGQGENLAQTLRGWMDSIGPVTARALAERLGVPVDAMESGLAQLESEGLVLRGHFSGQEEEFCHRRILARIHRLTLGKLRREIEPVTAAQFARFLDRWQHVSPGSQLHGADGLLQILKQLQGYEISSAAWEADVLPRRVAKYDPELLDRLCLAGEIMWGRLSPHPALEVGATSSRRVRPTRVAPLSIFLREDASYFLAAAPVPGAALSHAARDVPAALAQRGAAVFN